jgi:hypothetical protein
VKFYTLTAYLLFSNYCIADHRNFLFIPQTQAEIKVPSIAINDSFVETTGYVVGGLSGSNLATVISKQCAGTDSNLIGIQEKTAWLIIPKEVSYNGVSIELEVLSENGWRTPNQSVSSQYSAKVYQERLSGEKLFECWDVGSLMRPILIWRNASINVKVGKQSIKPGSYRIPVDYYYAFEENKYTSQPANAEGIPNKILSNSGARGLFYIDITAVSVCKVVDGENKSINLSHGTMTTLEADRNKTQPYNLKFKCNPSTSVSIKLLGGFSVPGKTGNFTKCGTGYCELNFNGNKYDEKLKADNNGDLDVSITSTFHLNRGDITGGAFRGSAVLIYLLD